MGIEPGNCAKMSYWRLFYHLIWATKSREPLIDARTEELLLRSMQTSMNELQVILHAVGFMPDHVHVATSIPPKLSISDVAKRLKGASSRAVTLAQPYSGFGWQEGYGVISVSERALPIVIEYVSNQKEHHARDTTRHGLELVDVPRVSGEPGPRMNSRSDHEKSVSTD